MLGGSQISTQTIHRAQADTEDFREDVLFSFTDLLVFVDAQTITAHHEISHSSIIARNVGIRRPLNSCEK